MKLHIHIFLLETTSTSSSFEKLTMGSSGGLSSVRQNIGHVQKFKLKTLSVFGDFSSMFASPVPEIEIESIPKHRTIIQNQYNSHDTDTSFTATMQRLQVCHNLFNQFLIS